jgi:Ca-activated chloride channel family protein
MKQNINMRIAGISLIASALATIVAGCASVTTPGSPPPQTQQSPPASAGGDGQLEEILVTGSASSGSNAMATRAAPAGKSDADAFANALAGGRIGSDEEVWIIATPTFSGEQASNDDSPGSGAMVVNFPDEVDPNTGRIKQVPLPLQHTAVSANIDGFISSVSVQQQFANPFDTKIEAVYLFPLPEKAAVTEFLMIIGERRIRGILREKEEAVAIYEQARAQGYQASLLVQHRPNIFEQKVANIEPGKQIDVKVEYLHTLAYHDGWYSFVFPTVVGPRFNPPGHNDPIHADARGTAPRNDGATVQYLRPDERSAHDISFDIVIDAGVAIEELRSTHKIRTKRPGNDRAEVQLAEGKTMPNRDFLLEFRVAGDTIKSNLLTHFERDENRSYFTLMVYPPADLQALERQPLELVFVLDCSGSMRGAPLQQAKAAVSAALEMMDRNDTFQIIRFSDNASYFGTDPVAATRDNIASAQRYLASLHGTGGTMMLEGIKAALDFPHDPSRLRFVTFLTDGYIGNESDIIGAVHKRIGATRIFSFGVGSSVNRYLLERMAKEGRGVVAYLGPQDSGRDVMQDFFDRIGHPAMTDLSIDFGSMVVTDRYPSTMPDLFVGRPVVITGKYAGTTGSIEVSGNAGGRRHSFSIPVTDVAQDNPAIARVWARLRIADLKDRQSWADDPHDELAGAIRDTALHYHLMSDYTSFVAVDASERTDGSYGITVQQAVPVPDGVRYDTTVNE